MIQHSITDRLFLGALALSLLFWVSCSFAQAEPPADAPASRPTSRPLATPRNDLPGLPNFAQLSPAIYRSAQPTAEGFRRAKELGIRTIVNLRALHSDEDELEGTGLRYLHVSFKPWHPEEEDVVAFLKVVTDPSNQPVLVHCQHGADRTGMMVAIYRMAEQGWSLEEAMAELPNFGFHSIWENLKDYLKELDLEAIEKKVEKAPVPEVRVVE